MQIKQRKAVALISGGLDSMLAAKVIMDQGVHVEGINFFTGFCVEGHTHAIRKKQQNKQKRNNALWVAEQLGIKLHIIDVVEPYKDVVLNPKFGYGAHMNPCLDCKVFMVKNAKDWMLKHGFDFIITGEVVGQRPMSQTKNRMPLVEKKSETKDILLRPLCAHHFPETLPERQGWVDRNKLLNLSGRGRSEQITLAKKFNFDDYAQPAGGCCFLTDKAYSQKLADLWQSRGTRKYELDDIMLLKVGRHIRPKPHFKLIIAREEGENNFLAGYRKRYTNLFPTSCGGPLAIIDGTVNDEDLHLAARIVARFSQGRQAESVTLEINAQGQAMKSIAVIPLRENNIDKAWYV